MKWRGKDIVRYETDTGGDVTNMLKDGTQLRHVIYEIGKTWKDIGKK